MATPTTAKSRLPAAERREVIMRAAMNRFGSTGYDATRLDDGDLMLSIEPHHDGSAVVVGAHSLAEALAEADRLLARY